jgi:hypothetical protein
MRIRLEARLARLACIALAVGAVLGLGAGRPGAPDTAPVPAQGSALSSPTQGGSPRETLLAQATGPQRMTEC